MGFLASLPLAPLGAQDASEFNEGSKVEWDETNEIWRFTWWGKTGRTYFIQHSDDLREPWQWVPMIEVGDDSIKEWGFTTTGDRFFVRLKYTDRATLDPEGDDFDGDEVPNLFEIENGFNPFGITDTDNNGLPDEWELYHASQFAIWPPALSTSLPRGQTASRTIYLRNDTASPVNYSIALTNQFGPAYSFQDSVTGDAVYTWEDISASGTLLSVVSAGDDNYEKVALSGFAFPFYGANYTSVFISSNGFLAFGNGDASYYNIGLPSRDAPTAIIAPFWDDHYPGAGGNIYILQEPARVIIQYQDVNRYGGGAAYTFQVVLHADGRIQFRYQVLTGDLQSCTVGIQDAARRRGLQMVRDAPYLANGLAIDIFPTSQFLSVSPASGTVPAYSTEPVTATFHSFELPFKSYTAAVTTTHDAADIAGPHMMAATLKVTIGVDTDGDGIPDDIEGSLIYRAPNGDWGYFDINDPDTDHNGIPDGQEDYDQDGLTVLEELALGTDPNLMDTDGDSVSDGMEVSLGTDPLVPDAWANRDSDGDGLEDLLEILLGTNPFNPDTNGNGMNDQEELDNGGDPANLGLPPTPLPTPVLGPERGPGLTPIAPPSLSPGTYDILVESQSISFPKYGHATLQTLDPPKRYLVMTASQIFAGSDGKVESGPLGINGTATWNIDPLTGETTKSGADYVQSFGDLVSPLRRSGTRQEYGYDDPPNEEEDGTATIQGMTLLANENTTPMMVSNGKSKLEAFTGDFQPGTPWAYRNVTEDELLFQYQKVQFKFQWKEGVTQKQRYALTYLLIFQPEDDPEAPEDKSVENAEIVGNPIKWDGQGEKSQVFTIDPDERKSGVDGSYYLLPIEIELRDIKGHANTGDDVTIANWNTAQNIAENNIAWIEAHTSAADDAPRMPQLEFQISNLPQSSTIEAKLEVKYDRGNGTRTARNQAEDTVKIPSDGSFKQVSGDTWQIWSEYQNKDFFGGNATLTYRLKSGSTEILPETKIDFRIGGKNPDDAQCQAYIESLPDAGPNGSLWFAYAIAKSESKDYNGQGSRYNQFLELPTHTQDVGRPLWGNDGGTTPGGYGMFQVTGNASDSTADIPRKQIWNWQENIAGGLAILASKRTTAVAWINQQKNANNANGTALPDHAVGIVTFSEGTTRTMTHAITVKLYNGASRAPTGFVDSGSTPGFRLDPRGSGHYCFWRKSSNEWALNRFNDPPDPIQPFNYVARVCEEVEN